MNKKNICFIGHGKMIQGIIKDLDFQKFSVFVTTRSNKQNQFDENLLSYTQFDIKTDSPPTDLILQSDLIVFTLPPVDWEAFERFFLQVPIEKTIIFTSSISVYQKNQGKIDETGPRIDPEKNLLTRCEDFLKNRFKNIVILRLGGLYGKNRHPIYSLSGKNDLKGSEELIHLVSHEDAQKAIKKIIDLNIAQGIYNIISDQRDRKKVYYSTLAEKLHLPLPLFLEESKKENVNNISNQKSKDDLKLTYQNPHDFLGVENE